MIRRRFNPKLYRNKYSDLLAEREIFTYKKEITRTDKYLKRARTDLLLARIILKISRTPELKKTLGIREDYVFYNWVIVTSYYGMYHAATAAIARKGLKAKSHVATIVTLAKHYTLINKLEREYIRWLEDAYITSIDSSRISRTIAQYNVDAKFERKEAEGQIKKAEEFITRIEEICSE